MLSSLGAQPLSPSSGRVWGAMRVGQSDEIGDEVVEPLQGVSVPSRTTIAAGYRPVPTVIEHSASKSRLGSGGLILLLTSSGLAPAWALQGVAVPAVRVGRPNLESEVSALSVAVHFEDVAVQAGLTAPNISGQEHTKEYILETTGNGVAIIDYDNDGLADIFLPNASTFQGPQEMRAASTQRLYRNVGNLRFKDVTEAAGLRRTGWGQGVCVGDYDNDGYRDLFVTFWGHSSLYRNQGDGTFLDVTSVVGLKSPTVRWDTGCTFVDYDLDGRLDLAVAGYVGFDKEKIPKPGSEGFCKWKGLPVMCGPRGLPFGRNYLFRNVANGQFKDVSESSGIGLPTTRYTLGILATDFDNDGYPDIYGACDSTPSLLYHNQQDGTFAEIGILAGVALNEDGQEQAGMGVAAADYDEDGFMDLVKTNFADDVSNLYRNNGDGTFTDMVYLSGLGSETQFLGWGVHFLDVDHDGRLDVLLVNGHVYPEIDQADLQSRYHQQRQLYWNVGQGRFKDISNESGPGIEEEWSSRGSAVGDLDNDGSLEVVINNMGDRPSLLRNSAAHGSWLLVRLEGVQSNRDAIGARVSVVVGNRRLSRELQGGSGYISQDDSRLHFGLGGHEEYDSIEVEWPGGQSETFGTGKANRMVVLREGEGSAPAM